MFRSHIRGLKWIIIRFIHLFLCVVLLILSVFSELKFISLNHKIRRCFWGPENQRRYLKWSKMAQHGHSIANTTIKSIATRNQKRKKTKEEVHPRQPPPRATHGGCHVPWWWTWRWWPPLHSDSPSSFVTFWFPGVLQRLKLNYSQPWGHIPLIHHSHPHKIT